MEWYDWVAYAFIAAGIYFYLMKKVRDGGKTRVRRRKKLYFLKTKSPSSVKHTLLKSRSFRRSL